MSLEYKELTERYRENMKKAASICRQLSVQTKNAKWSEIAAFLDGLRKKGEQLYDAKALTNQELNRGLDQITERAAEAQARKAIH